MVQLYYTGTLLNDALVVIMPKDVVDVHQDLNNIDNNLRCTIFNTLFYMYTGLYAHDSSKVPWVFRVS